MLFKFFDKFINKNAKYYDHYISLGYNCECAYRFAMRHHFVEASLFTWANSINIKNLIKALSDIDAVLGKEPEVSGVMWRCLNTDIRFHGTEPSSMHAHNEKYLAEDWEPYRKELVSRINHLKEKFKNQLSDHKKTLFTYTYRGGNGEEAREVVNNIRLLKKTLEKAGANNFELLIILEKSKLQTEVELKDTGIYIRYVDELAPEDAVTTKKYDKKSWRKIFREFKPNFKLKKRRKFKFEDM